MKLALGVLLAAFLTGCAISNGSVATRPANYRQLVADNLPAIKGVSLAGAEISALNPSVGAQWGDWATCLKTVGGGRPRFFAIFFSDKPPQTSTATEKTDESPYLIEARESVVSDRCEAAVYSRLPPKTSKSKKAMPKEKPRQ